MKIKLYSSHVSIFSGAAKMAMVFLIGMASVVSGQVSIGGTPPSFSQYVPDILQTVTPPLVAGHGLECDEAISD